MIFLVTNRHLAANEDIFEIIKKASKGGLDGIIIREKDMEEEELYIFTKKIIEIAKDFDLKIMINSSRNVAQKLDLGLHLPFLEYDKNKDFKNELGISVHSKEELIELKDVKYVLAGHVFETDCKKDLKPRGTEFIRGLKEVSNISIMAIGGINKDNAKEVLMAGADSIAIMSGIIQAKDPCKYVKDIKRIITDFKKRIE